MMKWWLLFPISLFGQMSLISDNPSPKFYSMLKKKGVEFNIVAKQPIYRRKRRVIPPYQYVREPNEGPLFLDLLTLARTNWIERLKGWKSSMMVINYELYENLDPASPNCEDLDRIEEKLKKQFSHSHTFEYQKLDGDHYVLELKSRLKDESFF